MTSEEEKEFVRFSQTFLLFSLTNKFSIGSIEFIVQISGHEERHRGIYHTRKKPLNSLKAS
jgi:hypothetical protein